MEKVKKMAIAFQNRFGNEAGVAISLCARRPFLHRRTDC